MQDEAITTEEVLLDRNGSAAVIRLNPREKRVLVIVPVLLGLLTGERVLRLAQRRGKGI